MHSQSIFQTPDPSFSVPKLKETTGFQPHPSGKQNSVLTNKRTKGRRDPPQVSTVLLAIPQTSLRLRYNLTSLTFTWNSRRRKFFVGLFVCLAFVFLRLNSLVAQAGLHITQCVAKMALNLPYLAKNCFIQSSKLRSPLPGVTRIHCL